MAEAHLYLLCADLLLRKERRVGMAERVKAQIGWELQALLEVGEDVRCGGQCHRLRLIAQRAKDIVALRKRNALLQQMGGELLLPRDEVLHRRRGECDRAGTVGRLGRTFVLLRSAFPSLGDADDRRRSERGYASVGRALHRRSSWSAGFAEGYGERGSPDRWRASKPRACPRCAS